MADMQRDHGQVRRQRCKVQSCVQFWFLVS